MKITKCRSCSSKSLKYISTLGNQYFTGIFPGSKNQKIPKGNLSMVICNKCSLLQLQNSFDVDAGSIIKIKKGEGYQFSNISLNSRLVTISSNNYLESKIS